MKLTILVPVFNEHETILQAINNAKLIRASEKEIIIVDNSSTDGTKELLKKLNDPSLSIVFHDQNYGAGKSIEDGIKMARGEYIYIYHSDLEYDYRDAEKMLDVAEKGHYDAVLGSRLKNRSDSIFNLLRQRPAYTATIIATALVNRWYNKNFTDIIGSKLYRTASVRNIPIDTYGPGFDFEHVSRMCKLGLNMTEIAINFTPRSFGKKKIKFYNMINALFSLFKVRLFG